MTNILKMISIVPKRTNCKNSRYFSKLNSPINIKWRKTKPKQIAKAMQNVFFVADVVLNTKTRGKKHIVGLILHYLSMNERSE